MRFFDPSGYLWELSIANKSYNTSFNLGFIVIKFYYPGFCRLSAKTWSVVGDTGSFDSISVK